MRKFIFFNQTLFNVVGFFKCLMFATLLAGSYTAYAQGGRTDMIESAYPLKIVLDTTTLEGYVLYEMCDWDAVKKVSKCSIKEFQITPETKAYEDNEEVPLRRAKSRLGKYAEVVYYEGSLVVRSLSW